MIGSGKTALVTGASGGIGRAFAELFAADGWRPIVVARSVEGLGEVAADLKKRFDIEATVIALDLAVPDAAQRLYDEVAARALNVDALVNNAGFPTYGRFAELPLADEHQEIVLNVLTLTDLTKLFLPPMLRRKWGRILNVASTAAFAPGPTMAVYYATKAYVLSFSEALSNEVAGSGVSVTCIAPGATATGFEKRGRLEKSALFQGRRLPDARSVAQAGYRAMLAGKRLVIPGLWNQLQAFAPRLSPRGLTLAISRRILDPR